MPSDSRASAPACTTQTEGEAGAASSIGPEAICTECGKVCKTYQGMRVHLARAHKDAMNREIETSRLNIKKARWDPEEARLLAIYEAELIESGEKFLNMALERRMPGRSLEAIKGQRKNASHKTLVKSLLDPTKTDRENPQAGNNKADEVSWARCGARTSSAKPWRRSTKT